MNGRDRGKITDGPSISDGTLNDMPVGDPPSAAKPAQAPPRAPSPWDQSRPGRAVRRRPLRKGATAPGGSAALGLVAQLGRLRWTTVKPPRAWAPWLGGAVLLAWLASTSLHPVGAHEQAVVATFGAAGPTHGPGLALSAPWPIGSARIADVTTVRRLSLAAGEGEHLWLTRDAALVDLAFDVRWRIRDLRQYAQGLADADGTLRLAADSAMRATLAGTDFAAALGAGRDALGHEAARRLQASLDRYRAGIAIDGIDVRRLDPPARVADALRKVAAARSDAAAEADLAQTWSRQVIADAQGEADAFERVFAQYRLAPAVTRQQMYYATMERVLRQSDTVIVDARGSVNTLPPLVARPAPSHAAKAGDAH